MTIAATNPRDEKTRQLSVSTAQKSKPNCSCAPHTQAKAKIINEDKMPRTTLESIFPTTKAIGRIGASKYSSSVLWYNRLMLSGVATELKLIFMEFNAKIPGTIKSKYEPPPDRFMLRPSPQPKATKYRRGATMRDRINAVKRRFSTSQSRQKTVAISYSIIPPPFCR